MAARIGELETAVHRLAFDVFSACPDQYRKSEKIDADDRLAVAWLDAIDGMMHGSTAIEHLGGLLRERAGDGGATPFDRLNAEMNPAGEPESTRTDAQEPGKQVAQATRGDEAG